jgi:hypothetical protein
MHRCRAEYVESVPIREEFSSEVVWEGVIEVFNITGNSKAKRCYAWSYLLGPETQFITVLEIPPVDSPVTALRASITAPPR